jgi:hypothetical protein
LAADVAGFAPDPEQRMALDVMFATRPDNRAAAFEVAVICSRQNLKTALFQQAALGWLFVTDQRLIVWSAHEFRTAQEAFRDLAGLVEGSSWLRKRLKRVYGGAGDEAIELLTGQRVIFKARTSGGGRGLTGDKIVLDEAFALQPAHMGALLPTLSAVPDPQVVYGSSAGLAQSAILRSIRDRGRPGDDPSLAYIEWCDDLPGSCASPSCSHELTASGCALDDRDRWARSNPALGRRISVDYVAAERRALPPAEFARERLGWWDDPAAAQIVIPARAWNARAGAEGRPDAPVVFALSAAWPDAEMGSIAVVGRRGGEVYAQLVEYRPGTSWMPARMRELQDEHHPAATMLDDKDPAACEKAALVDAGVKLTPVTSVQAGQAFGMMISAVMGDQPYLRHYGQAEVAAAVAGATKRPLGDAHVWARKGPTDISPVVAFTDALYGLATRTALTPFVLLG